MQDFSSDVLNIGEKVSEMVERAHTEYRQRNIDPKADYVQGAAWVNFMLGSHYHQSAQQVLLADDVLSGGSLVRTQLENAVDLYYILADASKRDQRAQAYVNSIDVFSDAVAGMDVSLLGSQGVRLMNRLNKWTDSTINDRLEAAGGAWMDAYDMFSYHSHPNPASLLVTTDDELRASVINSLQRGNEFIMLDTMALVLNHSDLSSVTIEEVNQLANKLGTRLLAPVQ